MNRSHSKCLLHGFLVGLLVSMTLTTPLLTKIVHAQEGTDQGYDEFNSNPQPSGTDEFNSNSQPSGSDEFNSNGDGESEPHSYPTAPPRFPCGPNALENQAWGGPFASGFLGLLKPLVIPNCPRELQPRRPIFTYFYINGINTPRTKIYDPHDGIFAGNWRGSCQTEHDTAAQNLLDLPVPISYIPKPRPISGLVSIKVANEIDRMYTYTCNASGADPWGGDLYARYCIDDRAKGNWLLEAFCTFLQGPNSFRSGQLFKMSLSVTDLLECIRQGSHTTITDFPSGEPITGIDFTAEDQLVVEISNAILAIYRKERMTGEAQKHYFIIIGHSQGNFFVEGVAYRLLRSGPLGQQIFWNRLGIISLGSPTSYDSLPPNFVATKIKHRTRRDDAINILFVAAKLLPGRPFKLPWPLEGDDPSLWSWRGDPAAMFWQPANAHDALAMLGQDFGLMSAAPPAGPSLWSLDNSELYEALLNSHLADNYLDDPAASNPGVPISADLYKFLYRVSSPPAPPLLNAVRGDLRRLKLTLLQQSGSGGFGGGGIR